MTPPPRIRPALLLATVLAVAGLVGCGSVGSPASTESPPAGDVVDAGGAAELAEPARALVIADEHGELTLLDLETEEREVIAEGAGEITGLDSNGRFVFVSREDAGAGSVEIVDSGRWTMPHGDHSHYFRGEPRTLGSIEGSIEGDGAVVVGIGSDGTGVSFGGAEAVILDHETLAEEGTAEQGADAATQSGTAGIVLPFAGQTVVATASAIEVPGSPPIPCAESSDADITRVGAVFACADGAVLVTREVGGALAAESIPYPTGTAAPASALAGRADRPDLAGVAAEGGAWLLDVRQRAWTLLPSDTPLLRAVAIGDDDSRTVAVDADGRVRILGADGAVLARTEPLVDPDRVQLLVDAEHAYVSDSSTGDVHEIDLDDARVSRTFSDLQTWAFVLVG